MTLRRLWKWLLIVVGGFAGAVFLIFIVLVGAAAYYASPQHRPDIPQSATQASSTQPH